MALADILVHIDNTPNCAARLKVALKLAKRHQSSLTGLYVISHTFYEPRHGLAEVAEEAARNIFDQHTKDAGIPINWLCVDWSVIGVSVSEIINHHAHYTDLVVVGQTNPDTAEHHIPADLPERIVAGAGRPVLIIPFTGTFPHVGNKILVAWKAGRESTRAVNDALPFLKTANKVTLLAVNSFDHYGDDESLCADIGDHLARHGIMTSPERVMTAGLTIGDTMLNRACDEGFDLLVMGAYAHTPQGTLVLGEVARHLLKHMTIPVLMSH
jgi:nucleotide-binding universal stress UspA family protein